MYFIHRIFCWLEPPRRINLGHEDNCLIGFHIIKKETKELVVLIIYLLKFLSFIYNNL